MNTINDSITFGAKLDYSKVLTNKTKWAKIAAAFENKTKAYPKDTFILESDKKGRLFFDTKYYSKRNLEFGEHGKISAEVMSIINMLPIEEIADKLKLIFSIRKSSDKMLADYYSLENKYKLMDICNRKIIYNTFHEFLKLRNNFIDKSLNKDKLFRILKKGIYMNP